MRIAYRFGSSFLVALAFLGGGCGSTPTPPAGNDMTAVQGCSSDGGMACPAGQVCGSDGRCKPAPTDCDPPCAGATPLCDKSTLACVGCLGDTDCPMGTICVRAACMPGCSSARPCAGDAGQCDVDLGVCRGCLDDRECSGPTPRCDNKTGRCEVCLADNDNCPSGQYCREAGGARSCEPGCKARTDCAQGQDCCAHTCKDTNADAMNCGACGTACGGGGACCQGRCANLSSDAMNCGACGTACMVDGGKPACNGGKCSVAACDAGRLDCDRNVSNGCEIDSTSDTSNCSACGQICPIVTNGTQACKAGRCAVGSCKTGWDDCDGMLANGCEAELARDANHCGACGKKCPAGTTCSAGQCTLVCTGTKRDCDGDVATGCESDITSDPMNCNGCGNVCNLVINGRPKCTNGLCGSECNAGAADCDGNPVNGCEAVVSSDPNNCGGCGKKCTAQNGQGGCISSTCTLSSCNQGYGNCDNDPSNGCEANFATDAKNCGACANACPAGRSCSGGQCSTRTIPGFNGQLGPDYSADGWLQCIGFLDRSGTDDIPQTGWATPCVGAGYNKLRVACGAGPTSVRYIDVSRNVFATGLNSYPESNLITGANFTYQENNIWATGNQPNTNVSWWGGGSGCGESNANLTINNSCSWDASNCFGQNIAGERYLYVYVKQ